MGRTERGDCFIPLHSTCTVKMQSRHARRRIHHVCECTRGKRTAEGRARRVRLPLSTPLRYQPWLDIINGNAIFSSAMQFRIPLSRIRSSCTPISQFLSHSWLPSLSPLSLSLSLSPFDPCDSFISSHSRVCYFVYFSLVPFRQPIQRMNNPLRFPRLHGFRNRRT